MGVIVLKKYTVTVDRPLGSAHPRYPEMIYPVNYGYVDGIMAPDGMCQDAYILGIDRPVREFTGKLIAVIRRRNDVEDKWVISPENAEFTREEIERITYFQEKYFESEIIMLEDV